MKAVLHYLVVFFSLQTVHAQQKNLNLIVGTYTNSCVSDGIYVEVKNGIKASDKIKVWNQGLKTEEPKPPIVPIISASSAKNKKR